MNAIIQVLKMDETISRSTISREIFNLLAEVQGHEGRHIRIEYQTDFHQLLRTVAGFADKGELTPIFNVEDSDIGPENGFWIQGTDDAGEIVHVQAVRFDDLSGTTLASHWHANPELYCTRGHGIDVDRSDFYSAPASLEITGPVCYHGELWLEQSYRAMRRLTSKLANLAMLLALARFRPDYIYCLMVPKVMRTGLSVRSGYLHMHPQGIRWHIPRRDRPYDEYLVWLTGEELSQLMDRPPEVC